MYDKTLIIEMLQDIEKALLHVIDKTLRNCFEFYEIIF